MDRPVVRSAAIVLLVASSFAASSFVGAGLPARGADLPGIDLSKLPGGGAISLPSSSSGGGKRMTVEQIRAKYDADRKRDELNILFNQKNFDDALVLAERIVAAYRAADVFDDEQDFEWNLIFAQINERNQKIDEAEASYRKTLEVADRAFGPKSRNGGKARYFLGKFQHETQQDHDGAFESAFAAVTTFRDVGESRQNDLPGSLFLLGHIEEARERPRESIAYFTEGCEILRSREGKPPIDLATGLRIIGMKYQAIEDYAEARHYFDEAAELYEALQGTEGADVKPTRELALQAALAATRKLPPDLAKEAADLVAKIESYQGGDDMRLMIPHLERLFGLYRDNYGEQDRLTLEMMVVLGAALDNTGSHDAAIKILGQASQLLDDASVAPLWLHGQTDCSLGLANYHARHYRDAALYLGRASKHYADQYVFLEKRLLALAYLCRSENAVGDFATALGHAETAAAIAPENDKECFRDTMQSCTVVAACAGEERELRTRADALLKRICERTEAVLGEKHPLTGYVLDCRAMFEYRNSDPAAIRTQERVRAIYRSLPPDDEEFDLLQVDFDLAQYRCVFGDLDGARELFEKLLPDLTGEKRRVLKGTVLRSLAMIDACQARRESAIARWREAIALLELEELQHARAAAMFRGELEEYLSGKLPGMTTEDLPVGFRRANELTFYEDEL